MRRIVALLAAVLLVASVVTPAAVLTAPTAAAQDDVPRGMVGVPNSNINENVPEYAADQISLNESQLEGSVMTSRHAESLNVEITTAAAARGDAWRCNTRGTTPKFCESPELTIRLTDDQNHDGRHVALPKEALAAELGRVPEVAFITHSSGEEYTVPLAEKGDLVVVEVNEFSTNDVTFSGEVSVTGNPATDGAQYSYNVSSLDAADNYTIDVTGKRATATKSVSRTETKGSGTTPITVGGTKDPEGPSSTHPQLEVYGDAQHSLSTPFATHAVYQTIFASSGSKSEIKFDNPGEKYDNFTYGIASSYTDSATVSIWIIEEDPDGTYGEGTLVVDRRSIPTTSATHTIQLDQEFNATGSSSNLTVEIETHSTANNDAHIQTDDSASSTWMTVDGTNVAEYANAELGNVGASSATVETDAGTSKTLDLAGETTRTVDYNLTRSATNLSWDSDGTIDFNLTYKEVSETVDPTIEVNGHTTGYTGTLSKGSTASLATNTSWLQAGENLVNVSMSAPAEGPTSQVGLDYRHDAQDVQTVEYAGETWTEGYNITRKYAGDQANSSVTIPFASSRVVAVRDAEYSVNGGSWASIPESDRSFDGSSLTLELGNMKAGDEVQVRANASKVRVYNGEITVLQPTVEGDALQTEVELSAWASDSYIDVSGTHPGDYLHHAENESWQSPSEYSVIRSDGGQEMHLPGASSGSTARIETLPMAVETTGDVRVDVKSAGFNPTFDVRPASSEGDSVSWSWEHPDLVTGTTYVLYSDTSKVMVDSDEAQSPVFFESGDDDETLSIFADDDGSSSSGGGGGMWADASGAAREFVPVVDPELVLIAAVALAGLGAAYSERASPDKPLHRRPGVWVGGLGAIVVAVLFIAPSAIVSPLQTALQASLPLLAIGAVGFAGLIAYGWYKARQKASEPPTIQITGRNK